MHFDASLQLQKPKPRSVILKPGFFFFSSSLSRKNPGVHDATPFNCSAAGRLRAVDRWMALIEGGMANARGGSTGARGAICGR